MKKYYITAGGLFMAFILLGFLGFCEGPQMDPYEQIPPLPPATEQPPSSTSVSDLCKDDMLANNQLIKDLTAKEAECDAIEAEWEAHPDKDSAEANDIVKRHRACLAEQAKLAADQAAAEKALDDCTRMLESPPIPPEPGAPLLGQ